MPDAPYAYERWVCSVCDGEPVNEQNGDADLRCETCGYLFRSGMGGFASYVPGGDDEFEDQVGEGGIQ
jgi:hypothetical protein